MSLHTHDESSRSSLNAAQARTRALITSAGVGESGPSIPRLFPRSNALDSPSSTKRAADGPIGPSKRPQLFSNAAPVEPFRPRAWDLPVNRYRSDLPDADTLVPHPSPSLYPWLNAPLPAPILKAPSRPLPRQPSESPQAGPSSSLLPPPLSSGSSATAKLPSATSTRPQKRVIPSSFVAPRRLVTPAEISVYSARGGWKGPKSSKGKERASVGVTLKKSVAMSKGSGQVSARVSPEQAGKVSEEPEAEVRSEIDGPDMSVAVEDHRDAREGSRGESEPICEEQSVPSVEEEDAEGYEGATTVDMDMEGGEGGYAADGEGDVQMERSQEELRARPRKRSRLARRNAHLGYIEQTTKFREFEKWETPPPRITDGEDLVSEESSDGEDWEAVQDWADAKDREDEEAYRLRREWLEPDLPEHWSDGQLTHFKDLGEEEKKRRRERNEAIVCSWKNWPWPKFGRMKKGRYYNKKASKTHVSTGTWHTLDVVYTDSDCIYQELKITTAPRQRVKKIRAKPDTVIPPQTPIIHVPQSNGNQLLPISFYHPIIIQEDTPPPPPVANTPTPEREATPLANRRQARQQRSDVEYDERSQEEIDDPEDYAIRHYRMPSSGSGDSDEYTAPTTARKVHPMTDLRRMREEEEEAKREGWRIKREAKAAEKEKKAIERERKKQERLGKK